MRRRLLIALAVGLAAIAGVIAVLPGLLDLNRFRPEIAALASAALGREVTIGGAVSLVMLPELTLTAQDVRFAAEGGGMTAAELRLKVTPAALLAGRIEARELVLRGMELRLPWPLPPSALAIRAPAWLDSVSARIERGRLRIGELVVSDLNATLATAQTTGTWQAAGTGVLAGRPWRFTLQLSQPGGDGSSGLDVGLDGTGPAQGAGAMLTGQVGDSGMFAGRLALWARDASALLPVPALPFRIEGRVTVADGLAAADEMAGDMGGVPVRTAVALRFSPMARLDLAVNASRLDLDGWKMALGKPAPGFGLGGLVIGVDVSAEAGQLWGGTLRGLRATVEIAPGGVELREARAVLPGEALLTAAGRLGVPALGQGAGFEGFFNLAAPDLRTTLGWAVPDLAAPEPVLRRAALAGRVVLAPGSIALDGVSGAVDDSTLEGSLALRGGARPAVKAALKLGRVDAGPWLGVPAGLAGWDAELRLEAREVLAAGVTLAPVLIEAGAEAGRVALRRLEAGIGPARITASGVLVDGTRFADVAGSVTVPAEGMRAEAIAALLPAWLADSVPPAAAIWRAPLRLEVSGGGTLAALTGRVVAQVGDVRVEASPTLDLVQGKWSGSLAARHPGAPRLLESLGIGGTPAWLGDGSFALVAQVQGDGDGGRIGVDSLDLTAGALHVTGSGAAVARKVSGRLDFETLPLPLPYPRAMQPFPALAPGGWEGRLQVRAGQMLFGLSPGLEELRGMFGFDAGGWRLDGVTARLAGGALSGRVEVETAVPLRLTLEARLDGATPSGRVFDLPLDLDGGRLDGMLRVTAAGSSPGALLATLAGEARVSVVEGVLAGVALAGLVAPFEAASAAAALDGGASRFGRLDLDVAFNRGAAVLRQATMVGPEGRMDATGGVDLVGGRMDVRLAILPAVADPPVLGVRLSGGWAAPARVAEVADLIRWRAEHPP